MCKALISHVQNKNYYIYSNHPMSFHLAEVKLNLCEILIYIQDDILMEFHLFRKFHPV